MLRALALALALPASAQVGFVEANMVETALHELGHALVDEFDLPVLGQEEDAVDAFAAAMLLEIYGPEDGPLALMYVAENHLMDGEFQRNHYYGVHDPSRRRGQRFVCTMPPGRLRDKAARWAQIGAGDLDACAREAQSQERAWRMVLEPHLLEKDAPITELRVRFAADPRSTQLRETGAVEIAKEIAERYQWRRPATIKTVRCGQVNAFWDPSTRSIELCLEYYDNLVYRDRQRG